MRSSIRYGNASASNRPGFDLITSKSFRHMKYSLILTNDSSGTAHWRWVGGGISDRITKKTPCTLSSSRATKTTKIFPWDFIQQRSFSKKSITKSTMTKKNAPQQVNKPDILRATSASGSLYGYCKETKTRYAPVSSVDVNQTRANHKYYTKYSATLWNPHQVSCHGVENIIGCTHVKIRKTESKTNRELKRERWKEYCCCIHGNDSC